MKNSDANNCCSARGWHDFDIILPAICSATVTSLVTDVACRIFCRRSSLAAEGVVASGRLSRYVRHFNTHVASVLCSFPFVGCMPPLSTIVDRGEGEHRRELLHLRYSFTLSLEYGTLLYSEVWPTYDDLWGTLCHPRHVERVASTKRTLQTRRCCDTPTLPRSYSSLVSHG